MKQQVTRQCHDTKGWMYTSHYTTERRLKYIVFVYTNFYERELYLYWHTANSPISYPNRSPPEAATIDDVIAMYEPFILLDMCYFSNLTVTICINLENHPSLASISPHYEPSTADTTLNGKPA